MSDEAMRTLVNDLPVPDFDTMPFTVPASLAEARVAIVTTAALRRPQDRPWGRGDETFRVLPDGARGLTVSHASPNWDRSGITADLNVAYPVDRLHELADDGVIGTVAPNHISFHGVIEGTLSTIRLDSGPAAARRLLEDGVGVVLLTPV